MVATSSLDAKPLRPVLTRSRCQEILETVSLRHCERMAEDWRRLCLAYLPLLDPTTK